MTQCVTQDGSSPEVGWQTRWIRWDQLCALVPWESRCSCGQCGASTGVIVGLFLVEDTLTSDHPAGVVH